MQDALLSRVSESLKRAALRPPDEPQDETALRGVVEVATDALRKNVAPQLAPYFWAQLGNAWRLLGNDEECNHAFEMATSLLPTNADFWFDWALAHEWALRFEEAKAALLRARQFEGASVRTSWNLALTETALGHGDSAIAYWHALGLDGKLTPSGMPWIEGLDPAEVRVRSMTTGHREKEGQNRFEVLSVQPLSPVHGIITSPSYGIAACDYGDVVLWHSPIGVREVEGKTIPRFALMALLHKGDEKKFPFAALAQTREAFEQWALSFGAQARVFRQDERLEAICSQCAAGDLYSKHAHEPKEQHRVIYGKMILSSNENLSAFAAKFEALGRASPGLAVAMPGLYEAIGDSAKAGKAHKAWAALARK